LDAQTTGLFASTGRELVFVVVFSRLARSLVSFQQSVHVNTDLAVGKNKVLRSGVYFVNKL
jgi:hypothetical protein